MIEKNFDIPFIADLALHEKQIQQEYRPLIAVHKWFARRPGTLFRGLILSEFVEAPLRDVFYKKNSLPGIRIADPFMGGGTPLLEANRLGCDVTGFDINPMAYWIVKQEIENLDLDAYSKAASKLRTDLEQTIGRFYRTRCSLCGYKGARGKYYLWVKYLKCKACGADVDLFPGYLVAGDSRHPKNVFFCPTCGHLAEAVNRRSPGKCPNCRKELPYDGPARRGSCACRNCGKTNNYPNASAGPPPHRLFAIEYYCPQCRDQHEGRFFKVADAEDLQLLSEAGAECDRMASPYVPDDEIPTGDETNRLHRWGYTRYREMFNERQLLGLKVSARLVTEVRDARIRGALATNLSDLLRYQNMLCRYDTMALKSLDIFSVHGFPVGLIQCESNLLGTIDPVGNKCIGSGGWINIIEKFRKAKLYCDHPFEVRHSGKRKDIVPIKGEWIGDSRDAAIGDEQRAVDIRCGTATEAEIPAHSLDAVFTDPPYFQNVQYAELMDFCYVWLRRLAGQNDPAFAAPSTRNPLELTGNEDMQRGLDQFATGLSSAFQRMAQALKPGSPLVFTYHHNDLAAYFPVAAAILDAGLTCSASFPCPAEMGASIHINGTGSSIVDTVFVCRATGKFPRKWLAESADDLSRIVLRDLESLKNGGCSPTRGDARCVFYGHVIRHAIWALRKGWDKRPPFADKMRLIGGWVDAFGGWSSVEDYLEAPASLLSGMPLFAIQDESGQYGEHDDEVAF